MRFGSLIMASLLAVTSWASAGEQILCPGTLKFVTTGDSVKTVIATCGQPLKVLSKKIEPQHQQTPSANDTRWYYSNMMAQGPGAVNNGIVTFNPAGNVIAIQGGQGNHLACRNGVIKVGSSMSDVSRVCGLPQAQATDNQLQNSLASSNVGGANAQYHIHQQQQQQLLRDANTLQGKQSMTILIYQAESYMPKIALTFFDDQLAQSGRVTSE